MWASAPDPGVETPFTSVTQWTWEDRVLSVGKRAAYLAYLDLPRLVGRPLELAVNLHPRDHTGDRGLLRGAGWRLIHPHRVAGTVSGYQRYLRRSRAEFGCPKPIHRELRTGWFSDRSACYLASSRPVLIEDTGLSDHLPTGEGLLIFRDKAEAVGGRRGDRSQLRSTPPSRARAGRGRIGLSPMSPRDVGRLRLLVGPYSRRFWNDTRTSNPVSPVMSALQGMSVIHHEPFVALLPPEPPGEQAANHYPGEACSTPAGHSGSTGASSCRRLASRGR